MSHLPRGWKTAPLGSLTEPVSKRPPTGGDGESFTYIDLSSIDQRLKQVVTPTEVPVAEAPSRARQVVATGDVLVSTVRPNLNGVAVVPPDLDGATASTGFCVLRPDRQVLHGPYLFHWVRSQRFIASMVRLSTGASYPAVTDRIVKSSELPLPPLEEQRRIAAILDKADELRAKRRGALDKLESLTQSIFLSMFGDTLSDQSSGHWALLNDLIDPNRPICYGILKPGPDRDHGVPYVRVVDMKGLSAMKCGGG